MTDYDEYVEDEWAQEPPQRKNDARRTAELLAIMIGPIGQKIDQIKARLDLIGAAAAGGSAPEFEKAIGLHVSVSALLDELRKEFANALVTAHSKMRSEWQRELFDRTSNFAHSIEQRRLEERVARLEMMLVPRRITAEFEARLRSEYASMDWDAAMRVFDRWLVYERPPHTVSSSASAVIRKFLKQWDQGLFRDGYRPGMNATVKTSDDDASEAGEGDE